MSDTTDPARDVLRDYMTREQLCELSRINFDGAALMDRASFFWRRVASDLAEGLRCSAADLAARTTERDQVASERDALRAEVEKLRAAQVTAPVASAAQGANPDAHTPGPWIVEDTGTHLWIGPPRSDGSGKVADIVVSMDIAQFTPEARARAIANACLIAAAPDLRASRPASLGDKAREALRKCMDAHVAGKDPALPQFEWNRIRDAASEALDALTDADLAPDSVENDGRDVVRAAKRFLLVDEDENASADDCDEARRALGEALSEYDSDMAAGRAARAAKGGAS